MPSARSMLRPVGDRGARGPRRRAGRRHDDHLSALGIREAGERAWAGARPESQAKLPTPWTYRDCRRVRAVGRMMQSRRNDLEETDCTIAGGADRSRRQPSARPGPAPSSRRATGVHDHRRHAMPCWQTSKVLIDRTRPRRHAAPSSRQARRRRGRCVPRHQPAFSAERRPRWRRRRSAPRCSWRPT